MGLAPLSLPLPLHLSPRGLHRAGLAPLRLAFVLRSQRSTAARQATLYNINININIKTNADIDVDSDANCSGNKRKRRP